MIFKNLLSDIDSVIARDPAATSRFSVILLYLVYVFCFYKISHFYGIKIYDFIEISNTIWRILMV